MILIPKVAGQATIKADLLVIPIFEKKGLEGLAREVDRSAGGLIGDTLAREGFRGKKGQMKWIPLAKGQGVRAVLIVGLGPAEKFDPDLLRKGTARAVREADKNQVRSLAVMLPEVKKPALRERAGAAAEGILLGAYRFDRYKTRGKDDQPKTVAEVQILVGSKGDLKPAQEAITWATAACDATNLARDLINTPARDLTPRAMAAEARKIAKLPGLSVRIYEKAEIQKMGMGGFLAVARGSDEPPVLIHMTYRPAGKARKRVAVVGKGVTFDSGGLSLKTSQSMETMKDDMSGSAAVLGVMKALAALRPQVEVHGICAMTENVPSGSSDKPGDIVRTMNGKTIEILNTDAEGRLTLADALPFALRQKPDLVIDVATLTGACVIALGELCAGIMGSDRKLIDRLISSGNEAGEKIWPLPMVEEYREEIMSPIADVKNIGGRWGGTITAGLFLQEFVDPKVPWAHVDIAGPAWTEKGLDDCPKGGTGFMVRTLLRFLATL